MKVCAVDGCGRTDIHARGMCNQHYLRWNRHGDPLARTIEAPYSETAECNVDGCHSRPLARHMCRRHYESWNKYGDPLAAKPSTLGLPLIDRFWAKVEKTDSCWLWTGSISWGGYPKFRHPGGTQAHRFSYETFVGLIPDGLHLDHLCRVRHCVNPAHLEPVTLLENTLRGESPAAKNARAEFCRRGHPLSGANLRVSDGHRRCRSCDLDNQRRRRAASRN